MAALTRADGTRVPVAELRGQLKAEAEVRARVQAPEVIRTPWQKPEFLADEFPNGYSVVPLHSNWPDITLCKRLGTLGYPPGALLNFAIRGHSPVAPPKGDRRRATATRTGHRVFVDVQHPYVPAAPGKRTKHSSAITKQQFSVAVVHMRLGSQGKAAFEVVVKGRPVPAVAKRHRLNRRTLEDTVYRVRQRVRQFIF